MPAAGVVAVFLANTTLVSLVALCVWTAVADRIAAKTRGLVPDPSTMLEREWRDLVRTA